MEVSIIGIMPKFFRIKLFN